jgi:hypothetical protein
MNPHWYISDHAGQSLEKTPRMDEVSGTGGANNIIMHLELPLSTCAFCGVDGVKKALHRRLGSMSGVQMVA